MLVSSDRYSLALADEFKPVSGCLIVTLDTFLN